MFARPISRCHDQALQFQLALPPLPRRSRVLQPNQDCCPLQDCRPQAIDDGSPLARDTIALEFGLVFRVLVEQAPNYPNNAVNSDMPLAVDMIDTD